MSSPLDIPLVRYGFGLSSAVVLTIIALLFLDGMMRWLVLGIAALEVVVTPQILKLAAEQSDA